MKAHNIQKIEGIKQNDIPGIKYTQKSIVDNKEQRHNINCTKSNKT